MNVIVSKLASDRVGSAYTLDLSSGPADVLAFLPADGETEFSVTCCQLIACDTLTTHRQKLD